MRANRTLKLVLLALATALLAGGAWLAQSGLKELAHERRHFTQLQRELHSAQRLLPEVQQREQLVKNIQKAVKQITSMGLDPEEWGERKLRRAQGVTSRVEAAQFLTELGRGGANQIFVAEVFDIATSTSDASLFHSPQVGDQGLTFGVAGSLYFKTSSVAVLPKEVQ